MRSVADKVLRAYVVVELSAKANSNELEGKVRKIVNDA
jgi:hypothetical protein